MMKVLHLENRMRFGYVFAVVVAVFLLALQPAKAEEKNFKNEAGQLITTLADTALKSLTEPDLKIEIRRQRVRDLLDTYFDFKAISQWVLGRYWRRATSQERDRFYALFQDLMVYSYADRFSQYSGEKLEIGKVDVRGGKDALVHTVLQRTGAQKPVNVVWRVRKRNDETLIVDIMIEGISMGITQQKEFASVIRNKGGKVTGLLGELENQLAALSTGTQ